MRTPARGLLLLLVVALAVPVLLPSRSQGELPTVTPNPNATRTITWSMNDSSGLTTRNVSVGAGRAELAWVPQTLAWSRSGEFAANGTMDENLTGDASGITLAANWSNRLADANFTTRDPWGYTNGTSDNVTATWDPTTQDGQLRYTSASTLHLWDGMDVYTSWTYNAAGVAGANYEETSGQKQGSGMQAIQISSGWSGNKLVALLRDASLGAVDWSDVDRLVFWFEMNSTLSVAFSLSAQIGATGPVRSTPAQALVAGWQRLTVDLDTLASSANRSGLLSLKLVLSGTNVPNDTWFYFDDLEIGSAKVFNETATVSQSFEKTDVTSPFPGSAYLSFDWLLLNATGVSWYVSTVSLGSWSAPFRGTMGAWQAFASDVSPYVPANGSYAVGFHLQVGANDTAASNVSLRIDNVSFVYPDRHNGSYLSRPLTFGADSSYLNLAWTAVMPSGTQATLSVRSGNSSTPGPFVWGQWQDLHAPGSYPLSIAGAVHFQFRAVLATANASVTSTLQFLSLSAESRAPQGTLVSGLYNASSDFLRWRSFNASTTGTPNASVAFQVGDGFSWYAVKADTPDANLSLLQGRSIQWRALFVTSDGLQTVAILRVQITYDFLGPIVRLALSPENGFDVRTGGYIHFVVTAFDAGSHIVPSSNYQIDWHTTDPAGHVYNNGTYHAGSDTGSVGTWEITATVVGMPSLSETIRVNVSASNQAVSGDVWSLWPYVLAILLAAVLGFAAYEVILSRMFAIDDVFLIAKDGRLIVHNTRRMRADRDEDILSGMLTAILAFIKDSDPEENGELKRFEIGGKTTLLERGEHVYLTAIYSGRVPRWASKDMRRFVRDLETQFGSAFSAWNGSPEDLQGVKEYMDRLASKARYRRPPARNVPVG